MKILFKLILFVTLSLNLNAATFDDAVASYLNKDYKKAFLIFEELANEGNVNAQYNLAMFYYKGIGVPKNKIFAFIWFDTASKKGHKLAQNRLGYMYEKGEIKGTKSEKKAVKEFFKSAVQNYDMAQLNLAMKYNSNIKEESLKIARFWYEKAANNGNTAAMNNLANMYYSAQTVKKDLKKAFELYLKAAKRGDGVAQFNISMMYYGGEYVKQNDKKALYWLEKSAKGGSAIAQVRLGTFYREGYSLVNQDYNKALHWYYKAANQNWAEGQYYVGFCYFYGFAVKADNKKAAYWMHKAKLNGYSHAKTFMARNKLYY